MKICKICGKEFISKYSSRKTCSEECKIENIRRIKDKCYQKNVKPFLPGPRRKLTREELKERERNYNNTEERKQKLKEYRKDPIHRQRERESGQRYRMRNPEVAKNGHLKRNFNITLEEYNNLLMLQNGVCAICGEPERSLSKKLNRTKDLSVDHCHKTGKVRGLLCFACNSSIGKFKDSIELLEKAIEYLKKYQETE